MAKTTRDHFIPRTYLRLFESPDRPGYVHVYRKRNNIHAQQLPEKICVERGGDANPYFRNPQIVRDYLSLFEPRWAESIREVDRNPLNDSARFAVAGLMAYLLVWTPTARRLATGLVEGTLETSRPVMARHFAATETDTSKLQALVGALLSPGIEIKVDPHYARAMSLRVMSNIQCVLFEGKWMLIRAPDGESYLTSDFPTCHWHKSESDMIGVHVFPLMPKLAVVIGVNPNANRRPDPKKLRPGSVEFGVVRRKFFAQVNEIIVKSAEDAVIADRFTRRIFRSVRRFSNWRMEALIDRIPTNDGYFQIVRSRPRPAGRGRH